MEPCPVDDFVCTGYNQDILNLQNKIGFFFKKCKCNVKGEGQSMYYE